MSEQIECRSRAVMDTVHHFYCDNCGKYLGYSTEFADGYYPDRHKFSLAFYIDSLGWRYLCKHFCNDCRNEFLGRLDNQLRELGFSDKEE